MSLYNSPKEHKLRKPRNGFDKIKQQHWDELKSPKEEIEMKPLIELGEQAKLRIKIKRQRLILMQTLIFTLVLIPLTVVAVNFFYKKVEASHKKIAPHHYQPIPPPSDKELFRYWKNGYTALANKKYEKAITHFDILIRRSSETTFGLTGLISLYYERCKNGNNSSCDLLYKSLERYKDKYNIREVENDAKIIRQINNFTQLQIEKVLSE